MAHHFRKIAIFGSIALVVSLFFIFLSLYFFLRGAFVVEKRPVTFGAVYMTMDNQYFEVLNSQIANLVEANGDILIARDGVDSHERQNEQILDLLSAGADFIFINPVDKSLCLGALSECERKKVPFLAVDSSIFDTKEFSMCVGTAEADNEMAGELIAQDLMQSLKKARLVVLYDKDIESTCTRLSSFLSALDEAKYPYEIVYSISATTLLHETMVESQKFLDLRIPFDALFAANDPSALGALAAIQNNNAFSNQLIYGIDGSPQAKTMVSQGFMKATAAQYPSAIARTAVNAAYKYLLTKEKCGDVKIPVRLLTKENIAETTLTGWQ